jgi:hypothetical protein
MQIQVSRNSQVQSNTCQPFANPKFAGLVGLLGSYDIGVDVVCLQGMCNEELCIECSGLVISVMPSI